MPSWWFAVSIKVIAPLTLAGLFGWNIYTLFAEKGGKYGYAQWAEIAGGWAVMALVFISGFIVKLIVKSMKKKGFVEDNVTWDEIQDTE